MKIKKFCCPAARKRSRGKKRASNGVSIIAFGCFSGIFKSSDYGKRALAKKRPHVRWQLAMCKVIHLTNRVIT